MTDFKNASEALAYYAGHIMDHGAEVGSRAGRTMEVNHSHFGLKYPWQREILVPGRKPNVAAQIAETMWVLSGRNDVEWLGHYLPRAADFSDDGETWRAGYGPRLRGWENRRSEHGTFTVDQFAECYRLLKADPSTRRAVMSLWDPAVDYAESKDIPCNNWLSWSSRLGYLDLSVAIRSNDLIWGWSGVNQFEWSALLEIMAGMLGLGVGKLVFTQTSFHIYDRHWNAATAMAHGDIKNAEDSPRFDWQKAYMRDEDDPLDAVTGLDDLFRLWFNLEHDIRTGNPLVQGYVESFPEPMLRSWLRVLQWWWSYGDPTYLEPLRGTRLWVACSKPLSVQPKRPESTIEERAEILQNLHTLTPIAALATTNKIYTDGDTCPRCDKGLLTTSGGRHTLRCIRAVCRFEPGGVVLPPDASAFINSVIALHNEKHAAYGDSWKRRGEMLGILANIARKIDRLGKGETSDETSTDTACDLLVYLAKYRVWIDEQADGPIYRNWGDSDTPGAANEVMLDWDRSPHPADLRASEDIETNLRLNFDDLERAVTEGTEARPVIVGIMLRDAYRLARRLWEAEQDTSLLFDDYQGADVD